MANIKQVVKSLSILAADSYDEDDDTPKIRSMQFSHNIKLLKQELDHAIIMADAFTTSMAKFKAPYSKEEQEHLEALARFKDGAQNALDAYSK